MALIVKIETAGDLMREFTRMGRGESFSRDGFEALIEYFEETEEGDVELDVIAIDCEFSEEAISEFVDNYSVPAISFNEWSEDNGDDEDNYHSYILNEVRDFIERNGGWFELIDNDTRIIYQAF